MVKQLKSKARHVLAFQMSGKLHDEDYKIFVPIVEDAIENLDGKIKLLVEFKDFHGWDPKACWDDLKFGVKHCFDMAKIAMVGDKAWEHWMAVICTPFTAARVKYFDISEIDEAWAWVYKD